MTERHTLSGRTSKFVAYEPTEVFSRSELFARMDWFFNSLELVIEGNGIVVSPSNGGNEGEVSTDINPQPDSRIISIKKHLGYWGGRNVEMSNFDETEKGLSLTLQIYSYYEKMGYTYTININHQEGE